MFRKKYYIVTSDTENIALRVYYAGKMTRKELEDYLEELNEKFPVLWLVFTARGLREIAHNKLQVNDLKVPDALTRLTGGSVPVAEGLN